METANDAEAELRRGKLSNTVSSSSSSASTSFWLSARPPVEYFRLSLMKEVICLSLRQEL